jgi:hypothetical protein
MMPVVAHYFSYCSWNTYCCCFGWTKAVQVQKGESRQFLMVFIAILVAGMNKSFGRSIFMTYLIKNRYPSSRMQADDDERTTVPVGIHYVG